MEISRKLLLVALLSLGSIFSSQGQIYDYGMSGGIGGYVGDLQPFVSVTNVQPGWSVFFKYNLDPHWGGRIGYMTTDIGAADRNGNTLWQVNRNLSFNTYISELYATVEFNFLRYITGHHKYNHTPFVFAGLSRFRFNPTTTINGQLVELQPLGTEGQGLDVFPGRDFYSLTSFAIPIGLGYRWNFYKFHSLQFELGARYAFTDYIDDVSLNYAGFDLMLSERGPLEASLSDRSGELNIPLREPFSQRGINTFNDAYWYASLSYIFTINSGRCPRFR